MPRKNNVTHMKAPKVALDYGLVQEEESAYGN